LIFEFGFNVNYGGGFVFRFRGVLRDLSLLSNEVEKLAQILRYDARGDVARWGQHGGLVSDT